MSASLPIVDIRRTPPQSGNRIASSEIAYAKALRANARTEQSRFLWRPRLQLRAQRGNAYALCFLRVAAALAVVPRRLRVAAALRPAARRFLVCAAF
jgi:hypothetical protein